MVEFASASCCLLRRATLTTLIATAACLPAAQDATARHHRHYASAFRSRVPIVFHVRGRMRQPRFHIGHRAPVSSPQFAAYAVDGNSGRVLYGVEENALRHPASITKVMTLYLLFEQIDKGRLTLDTRIPVSVHAAAQSPTKLGLRAGATIRVEDAIKAIVTESANDMAVAVAEQVGGDEDNFARLMTRKAHALGMARTTFVNASGLPDDRQITTAHDLSILGRAIHDRFPRYFRFFSTPTFRYAGRQMHNHNHLMEQVEGMDGIKTGYTRSSGFNLLSSVNRNGHWLVSVVLGGRTRLGRDKIMADIIEAQIDKCARNRTVPAVAENPALEQSQAAEAIPVVQHEGDEAAPVEVVKDMPVAEYATQPIAPPAAVVAAVTPRETPPAESMEAPAHPSPVMASVKPETVKVVTAEAPVPRARPAFVSGTAKVDMAATGSIRRRGERFDGTTSRYNGMATSTPSTLASRTRHERATDRETQRTVHVASLESNVANGRPKTHGGVIIQIGATPTLDQANDLIARAKSHGRGALSGAHPFTEKVQKGGSALYRARFAGLRPEAADGACQSLKRAGIACFVTRN